MTGNTEDKEKTKMQAQKSHMALSSAKGPGVLDTIKKIYVSEGPFGFYRGCIPPMIGGAFFRGLQFSVFEAFMTASKDNEMAKSKVPILNTELRIILGGIASGTARSVFECPFEYAKVRR